MKFRAWSSLSLLGLTLVARATATPPDADERAAREALRDELAHESAWIKVHAAEVLVAYGERALVEEVFRAELRLHPDEPRYRIGIHRVLARTATTAAKRATEVAWIEHVLSDPAAVDHGHAAETLGKLGAPHSAEVLAAARAWLAHATEEDAVYIHWLLWESGDENSLRFIANHLASTTVPARVRAAYALRLTGTTDPATLSALAEAADRETGEPLTRAIVIGAAYQLHATPNRLAVWRGILEKLAADAPPDAASQARQALLPDYGARDIERLRPLLTAAKGDVRIAAAWAILSCAKLKPPPPSPATAPSPR